MNRILRKYFLTILLLLALIGFVVFQGSSGTCVISTLIGQKQYEMTGMPAPRWELQTLAGEPFGAENLNGKVAVVNFWGTWCPNCLRELPTLKAAHQRFADQPVQFVGIAMNEHDLSLLRDFVEKENINYPIVRGDSEIAALFGGVNAVPSTFIIASDGTIQDRFIGALDEDNLIALINSLLPRAKHTQEMKALQAEDSK